MDASLPVTVFVYRDNTKEWHAKELSRLELEQANLLILRIGSQQDKNSECSVTTESYSFNIHARRIERDAKGKYVWTRVMSRHEAKGFCEFHALWDCGLVEPMSRV